MNKIAIFCHGVPNMNSNQPNADALMHAEKLADEGFQVKIFVFTMKYINLMKLKNIIKNLMKRDLI